PGGREHEVVGAGAGHRRIPHPQLPRLVEVGLRAHEGDRPVDALLALGGPGGGHQAGAVGPPAGADLDRDHASTMRPSGPTSSGSACAPSASSSPSRSRAMVARPASTITAPGRMWMKGDAWAIA